MHITNTPSSPAPSLTATDQHIALDLTQQGLDQWLNIVLVTLGSVLVLACCVFGIAGEQVLGASLSLMAIQVSTELSPVFASLLSNYAVAEQGLNAVERVQEYSVLEPEKFEGEKKPPSGWPFAGKISFKRAVASYRADLNPILKGLDAELQAGEKIGIVGRTGAGKSTLFLTLFRILELVDGVIEIDGVDISKLSLNDLRTKIAIIPQEPALFRGTLKYNLDPYGKHHDDALWTALEQAKLSAYVRKQPLGLKMEIMEGGSNFSIGQRQLVCLARALLVRSKILILDEATASVDVKTDALIQETIRSAFKECTVMAIAHRLNTVIDSDRILVLDQGVAKEFDSPKALLDNPESQFLAMVNDTGPENAVILKQVATGELGIKDAIAAAAANAAAQECESGNKDDEQAESKRSEAVPKRKRQLWKRVQLLMRKFALDKKMRAAGLLTDESGHKKEKDMPTEIHNVRSALSGLLQLENEMNDRGHTDMNWLCQMSQLAQSLQLRVQERLTSMSSTEASAEVNPNQYTSLNTF